jgi:hypothetical protein
MKRRLQQKGISVGDPRHFDPDLDPLINEFGSGAGSGSNSGSDPFFTDFKDVKNNFFPFFFLKTYPQAHYL